MFICEEVFIGFPDDFRLILETGPGKHCAIHCQKTALAIFKVNVVRQVVHQRGQEMSLAGQRGCDAMSVCDAPAESGYVPGLVLCISADFDTHFEATHRCGARIDDPKLAFEFRAFLQASGNFQCQSRTIAGIHQREEVVVLAGETPWLKTEKRMHLGVPPHDSFA